MSRADEFEVFFSGGGSSFWRHATRAGDNPGPYTRQQVVVVAGPRRNASEEV